MTPSSLARALWPEEAGRRPLLKSGRILAKLHRRGLILRVPTLDRKRAYVLAKKQTVLPSEPPVEAPRPKGPRRPELGNVLRRARRGCRVTQIALARAVGVSVGYLSAVEQNDRSPSERVLRALADALSLDFCRLLFLAGRLGEETERLLHASPVAHAIVRGLASVRQSDLKRVQALVEQLGGAERTGASER